MALDRLKQAVLDQLDPTVRRGEGLSVTNRILVLMILAASFAAVIETEPVVMAGREMLFRVIEIFFGTIFLAEYFLRLWVADLSPVYAGSRWPRLRHTFSPAAIIDLISILPALFALGSGGTLVLRFFRVLRILRLAKLGRLSNAWRDLVDAVHSRKEELLVTLALAGVAIVIASALLYWAEADAQPDKFGSIPRAFWWAVVTLTTVGYGDVYPITPLGKFLSGLVSVAGIGLVALPTGILAAAFSDAVQSHRNRGSDDGESDEDEGSDAG